MLSTLKGLGMNNCDGQDEATPLQRSIRESPLIKTIVDSFQQWTENEFSQKVLVPLLLKMGFRDVRFTGGVDEDGIDVLYWEPEMPEDNARFTGIQVKKGNIDAKVGKSKAPPALESQIQQAFAKPVGPPNKEPYTRITTLVICATGRIAPK